jgi:hypothetical protein
VIEYTFVNETVLEPINAPNEAEFVPAVSPVMDTAPVAVTKAATIDNGVFVVVMVVAVTVSPVPDELLMVKRPPLVVNAPNEVDWL